MPPRFFCHERETSRPPHADDAFARLAALLHPAMLSQVGFDALYDRIHGRGAFALCPASRR